MPFYEYKKHRQPDGELVNPGFVMRHEWGNMLPQNNTYVCYIPPEDQREFYVPDTLVSVTKEEFIQRVRDSGVSDSDLDSALQWAEEFWTHFEGLDNQ